MQNQLQLQPIINISGIKKRYGKTIALDGINLDIPRGIVFALLGPNGAGKTTLVRILTTLVRPDAGNAEIAGFDVVRNSKNLRKIIGLAGQYAAVDENLTAWENLELVGRLYHIKKGEVKMRSRELLKRFDLMDAANRTAKTYSGGMRRRLDLAASLVGQPQILFLDEPTTGLDPRSRRELWHIIEELVKDGTTVLLTTQYMEEADQLADEIAVMDRGKIIAQGTPDELKNKIGGNVLEARIADKDRLHEAAQIFERLAGENPIVDYETGLVSVSARNGTHILLEAVRELDGKNIKINDLALHRPTLDDVFLGLTGKQIEAKEQNI